MCIRGICFLLSLLLSSIFVHAAPKEKKTDGLNDNLSTVISYFRDHINPRPRYYSKRIQVCTTDLGPLIRVSKFWSRFLPAQHIGILVDSKELFADPTGGGLAYALSIGQSIDCHDTPVYVDRSEQELVDLISCIGRTFSSYSPYNAFDYNCGGFSRDVLLASGMDLPIVPNIGIGIWVPSLSYFKSKGQIQAAKQRLFGETGPSCVRKAFTQIAGK